MFSTSTRAMKKIIGIKTKSNFTKHQYALITVYSLAQAVYRNVRGDLPIYASLITNQ